MALLAFDYFMIDQLQDLGFVQTHHHVFTDQKCRDAFKISAGELLAAFGVDIDILFHEADFILRKKLFRRGTVRSGFGSKHDYVLHY